MHTPYYHYNTRVLRNTLGALLAARADDERFHVHYAVKATARPELLHIIASKGLGADCVSGGEIEAAIAAGFKPESIVFAGVGKADWEIQLALSAGIGCFNAESLPEIEVISQLAQAAGKTARVALRINPNIDAHTHEKITTGLPENKFGIDMRDMVAAAKRTCELPALQFAGLHFHIGSSILDLSIFARLCERINELQNELEAAGLKAESINVGGGLGTHYEDPDVHPIPDFIGYFDTFRKHLQLRPGQQLHFELGRSIVAQCGTMMSSVLYVKEGRERNFLILDAGFTDLIRPAFYNAHHKIENTTRPNEAATARYDVVGPICESSDVFQKDVQLPPSQRGDLIAFRTAGAYGEIMASRYNLRQLPGAVFE